MSDVQFFGMIYIKFNFLLIKATFVKLIKRFLIKSNKTKFIASESRSPYVSVCGHRNV